MSSDFETTICIDIDGEEVELEVSGTFTGGSRGYFNALTGIGSPPENPDIDFGEVRFASGPKKGEIATLTEKQEEEISERLWSKYEDGDLEPEPVSWGRADHERDCMGED